MSDRPTGQTSTSPNGGTEARSARGLASLLIPIAVVRAALTLVPLWLGDSRVLMGVAVLGLAFGAAFAGWRTQMPPSPLTRPLENWRQFQENLSLASSWEGVGVSPVPRKNRSDSTRERESVFLICSSACGQGAFLPPLRKTLG
jgi:hypothetical protein